MDCAAWCREGCHSTRTRCDQKPSRMHTRTRPTIFVLRKAAHCQPNCPPLGPLFVVLCRGDGDPPHGGAGRGLEQRGGGGGAGGSGKEKEQSGGPEKSEPGPVFVVFAAPDHLSIAGSPSWEGKREERPPGRSLHTTLHGTARPRTAAPICSKSTTAVLHPPPEG